MTDDEIYLAIEKDGRKKTEAVRQLLKDEGRLDIMAEFDAKMKAIANGTEHARNIWHSISAAQRSAMLAMERAPNCGFRKATQENLLRRGLAERVANIKDMKNYLQLTEHGRFVLNNRGTE